MARLSPQHANHDSLPDGPADPCPASSQARRVHTDIQSSCCNRDFPVACFLHLRPDRLQSERKCLATGFIVRCMPDTTSPGSPSLILPDTKKALFAPFSSPPEIRPAGNPDRRFTGEKPGFVIYPRRFRTICGIWFACESMAIPACCKIVARASEDVSWA